MSDKPLRIERVDHKDGNELIVGYSDRTTAVYGVEQLASLTPKQTFSADSNMDEEQMEDPK
jgi:hypothetical protein